MALIAGVATTAFAGTPPSEGAAAVTTSQDGATEKAEIKRLVAERKALERQVKKEISALPAEDPRRRQLAAMLAEIAEHDRKMERTAYVHAGTSDEDVLAYQADVRHRIERRGTLHFPVDEGRSLYGDLVLFLSFDKTGSLESVKVARSSGRPMLDGQAAVIAREAGPYEPFGEALRGKYDAVVVTARFHFAHETTEPRESATPQ
jgi:protein TonB